MTINLDFIKIENVAFSGIYKAIICDDVKKFIALSNDEYLGNLLKKLTGARMNTIEAVETITKIAMHPCLSSRQTTSGWIVSINIPA